MESASRTEALKLLMWTDVDPMSATAGLAGKLCRGKEKSMNTTQNNAMGVLALGRWTEKPGKPVNRLRRSYGLGRKGSGIFLRRRKSP